MDNNNLNTEKQKFSVLIAVYAKENPEHFRLALQSIWHKQTVKPDEIVIVEDGILPDNILKIIDEFSKETPVKRIKFAENRGLGIVLAEGVIQCKNEWIARMDSDDISLPERFEKQCKFIDENPKIDIFGSTIAEFESEPTVITSYRKLPLTHNEITKFAKKRNPLNHMTVFFKKQNVIKAGNYQPFNGYEDYILWVQMILNGSVFANINEPLVYARIGNNLYARRNGTKYFGQELKLQKKFLNIKFLNKIEYLKNVAIRPITRLLPVWGIKLIYKLLRHKVC